MPRPSLMEEIDELRAMCRLLPSVRRLRDRQDRAEEILDSVVSRLTALETELDDLRRENAIHRHPIFGAAMRGEVTSIELEPPYGLPCSSEYVNAQSGYDLEDGG